MTSLAHRRHTGRLQRSAIIGLDDPSAQDPSIAGRKAATLARLRRSGYPVPDGLIVPIGAPWPDTGPDDAEFPGSVLRRLAADTVAVRSSSLAEDTAVSSAAGRYRTLLHVRPEDIATAIREVRSSAGDAPMAVLLQPMIDAHAAGVAFGADPVTGALGAVTINAVCGVGNRVVDGSTRPEQWTVCDGDARQVVDVSPTADAPSALSADQALRIAGLVDDLGAGEGVPQDVEWAFDANGLRLLQSRPITALPTPPVVDLPDGTWLFDRHRYPEGMTPFGASLAAPEISRGLTATFDRCGALIERVDVRMIAGRPYLRFRPVGGRTGSPPAPVLGILARLAPPLRRRCRRARELLASGVLAADIDAWVGAGRDRCRRAATELLSVDVSAVSDCELLEHFDRVRALLTDGLAIHFRLMAAHLVGVYRLIDVCRDLWGLSRGDTLSLLAGHSPASDEPTRELVRLARQIASDPDATAAVLAAADASGDPGDDIDVRLAGVDATLTEAWQRWRRTYGIRTANDDPGSPTLLEIPGLLDSLLTEQVRRAACRPGMQAEPDGAERSGGAAAAAAIRLAALRDKLAPRTPAQRARFEDAWSAALAAYPVREDNVLWALAAPSGLARRAAVEMGVRLHRRGAIDDVRDAVMAEVEVLTAAFRGDTAPEALREVIARAKAERAWVATHPPPDYSGPPPAPRPDLRWLPRSARLINEALQLDAPDPASAAAQARTRGGEALLTGVPASAGRYTGPVRILTGPADFPSLRPGDVLVCSITDPAWSVLFGVAGAVIADAGGVLAHAAIIAREHAIPAVLGTGSATRDLADGQIVTVDGSAGRVLPAGSAGRVLPAGFADR